MPVQLRQSSHECTDRRTILVCRWAGAGKIMIDGPNIAVVNLLAIGNVHGWLE
jgi:hypothetical protein